MSASPSSSIVRFGTFELNIQTGELRRAGLKAKLMRPRLKSQKPEYG
jgi:hypothetical protein